MRIFIFYLLLLLIPSAYAYEGIFSILDEHYVENVSDLPASTPAPAQNIIFDYKCKYSVNNCIWVHLGIVGFKNTVRSGNDYYVQGNPAEAAIIQYDTHIIMNQRYFLDHWKNKIEKSITNGTLTVKLIAIAILCQTDENGAKYCKDETAVFTVSKSAPKQYPELHEPTVIITQYNNSLYENIGIRILNNNYSKITFDYKDKHAEKTFYVLHAETNEKGIVFGNITEIYKWHIQGIGISRIYDEILIDGNLSKMNISAFDIRAYNAFGSIKANPANFTIRREEFAPGKGFTGLFFGFIGVVGVLFYSTMFLLRRLNTWHIRLF